MFGGGSGGFVWDDSDEVSVCVCLFLCRLCSVLMSLVDNGV